MKKFLRFLAGALLLAGCSKSPDSASYKPLPARPRKIQFPSSGAEQVIHMGLIVDAVEEVANLAAAEIEPTPDFGTAVSTDYILGMAKVKGQVKTLLDLDRVVNADTVQAIAQAAA